MPKWVKISLISAGAFIALVVLLWLGIAAYVSTHKKPLLDQLSSQLNEHINGKLQIADIEPTLIRGFPGIGIALKNVIVRDSLWATHHHDLLNVKYIYVSVNAFSLIRMKPRIREITLAQGAVYLFTDSSGYTNTNLFAKKTESNKQKGNPRINNIYFEQVDFIYENKVKSKLFDFNVKKLALSVTYQPDGWKARVSVQTRVASMAFNTGKGSFLKNKQLTANLNVSYDRIKEELNIPAQKIKIDDDYLKIGGSFFVKQTPVPFLISIASDGIIYKNALSMVSPAIAAKADVLDFSKPIAVSVTIKGMMLYRDTPQVHMQFNTVNNTLHVPGADITDCSFSGFFNNDVDTAKGHNDPNSLLSLYGLKGKWLGIPFSADTIGVTNLSRPVLAGRFVAKFGVDQLNEIIGNESFNFKKGDVAIDLLYKGGVYNNDTTPSYILGYIKVRDAAVTYVPRNLAVTNSNFTLRFAGNDLYVDDVRLQTGSNVLLMEGYLQNFSNLYYTNPERILLNWKIKSSLLNLGDFIAFLPKRKAVATAPVKRTNKVNKIAVQLDKMLELGNVHMTMNVDKAIYKRFKATNIAADVALTDSGIVVKNTMVNSAGGKLVLNGNIDQRGALNKFTLKANITNVDVQDFFYQCGNFGQSAITDSNIKGTLDATVAVAGGMTENGTIAPHTLNGIVDFNLRNAAMVQFQPFMKIGKYVFRNRDMANVTFSNLSNKLVLKDDKFTIPPMHIESSALTMNVDGVYSLGKGTDINIDIPLRNPKKDELIMDDSIRQVFSEKGIVIHLKATDGDDGNVKIKWMMRGNNGDKANTEKKKNRRNKKQ